MNQFPQDCSCGNWAGYKYHIIDVIDDDGKITKTVTEGQLLNALISKSIRLSMGEI